MPIYKWYVRQCDWKHELAAAASLCFQLTIGFIETVCPQVWRNKIIGPRWFHLWNLFGDRLGFPICSPSNIRN
jgi:hypothetical protein